jgi:hypothetical protein
VLFGNLSPGTPYTVLVDGNAWVSTASSHVSHAEMARPVNGLDSTENSTPSLFAAPPSMLGFWSKTSRSLS